MQTLALALQVLLAVVFATAGVAKLLDLSGSREALVDFGVPARLAQSGGLLLPLLELATAAALVVHESARWGAVAAIVLLLAFIGGIARALAAGRAPDCHCFGQIHSAPAGRGTIVRNAVLAAVAAVVVVHGPGTALDSWIAARSSAELVAVALGITTAIAAAVAVRLWIDNRGLRHDLAHALDDAPARRPGLPVGTPAPDFALPTVSGETSTLDSLRARGQPMALVFVSPSCDPCRMVLPELARWQATLADRLTVAIISSGTALDNRPLVEEYGVQELLLQDEFEVLEAYRVASTPSALIVSADGRIASQPVVALFEIEQLIRLELRRNAAGPFSTDRAPHDPRLAQVQSAN